MADKYDYTTAGFDNFFFKALGDEIETESTEDVTQIKNPQISASSMQGNIKQDLIEKAMNDLIRITPLTTSSYLGLPNGYVLLTTSTLLDHVYPNRVMLGTCEITPYLNTLGTSAARLWSTSTYIINDHLDLHTNYTSSANGKSLVHMNSIYNNSGSSRNFYFYIRWRFLGTSTAGT